MVRALKSTSRSACFPVILVEIEGKSPNFQTDSMMILLVKYGEVSHFIFHACSPVLDKHIISLDELHEIDVDQGDGHNIETPHLRCEFDATIR